MFPEDLDRSHTGEHSAGKLACGLQSARSGFLEGQVRAYLNRREAGLPAQGTQHKQGIIGISAHVTTRKQKSAKIVLM